MKEVSFEVLGYCQPKQRTFGKGFVTPPETRQYEALVRLQAKEAMIGQPPLTGFVGLEIEIICAIPKSFTKKRREFALTGKLFPTHCDMSNSVKALEDGMNKIVFEDDRLVNSLIVRREYGNPERVIITVRSLE